MPRKVVRRKGGSLSSLLKKAHAFVKEKRLISSAARHFLPKSNLHKAIHVLGYGRKRRVVRRRRAGGSLSSILKKAHKFVKDKKLVSSALKHFGHHKLSRAAATLGYGRKRRVTRRRRVGGSLSSILSKAHKFIKEKKLVSSALKHFGHHKLSRAAATLGYGRKRRTRRRIRGNGFFDSIGNWFKGAANTVYNSVLRPTHDFVKRHRLLSKGLALVPHPAGKAAGIAAGLAGYGRRRTRRMGGRGKPMVNGTINYFKTDQIAVPKF
jgi:hypothetical protein